MSVAPPRLPRYRGNCSYFSFLGFHGVAPLIVLCNKSLKGSTRLQYANLVKGDFHPYYFNGCFQSEKGKDFLFTGLYPSILTKGRATKEKDEDSNLWSYISFFREDGAFEVFALIWTEDASYTLIPALEAFRIDHESQKILPAGERILRMDVVRTVHMDTPNCDAGGNSRSPLPSFMSTVTVTEEKYYEEEMKATSQFSKLLNSFVTSQSYGSSV